MGLYDIKVTLNATSYESYEWRVDLDFTSSLTVASQLRQLYQDKKISDYSMNLVSGDSLYEFYDFLDEIEEHGRLPEDFSRITRAGNHSTR